MSETQTAVNAIEMHGIVMEFSGVRALDGVDFSLRQGQVMGLVGKNGDMRNPVDPDRTRYFMEQAALAEVGT